MHKFHNIKKIKIILTALNFIKYAAWCGFFVFQGRAIQQAVDKNSVLAQLLQTLMWFFLTKLMYMVADLTGKFLTIYSENNEIETQWKTNFPKILYKDNETKSNFMYLSYFDYLPNLYHLECIIINNQCTIYTVLIIVVSLLIFTGFYYGILALLAIFVLNFLSKSICFNKLDHYQKDINENKEKIFVWIEQYFKAFREISFNWHGQVNSWTEVAFDDLYQAKKKFFLVQLLRDIIAQLMVELPFILNTFIVILAVYWNYLSITQLFVWIGFSQFVIKASNAFLENTVNQDKKRTLIKKLEEINLTFKIKIEKKSYYRNPNKVENVAIIFQDNTLNCLSIKPAIYHIKGNNGAGKSTLLNSIVGYERLIKINNYNNLKAMLTGISQINIRIIERESVIFDSLKTFNEQILGPIPNRHWKSILKERIFKFLSPELIKNLTKSFDSVEAKFYARGNGRFSSGEKVLISLMRVLTSWDRKVAILVVDECTAFLDTQTKDLFLRCLFELSLKVSVYLSTHEIVLPTKINLKTIKKIMEK